MNSKNQKVLNATFNDPVSPSIPWEAIEKLLLACGAEISEGNGSRVRVAIGEHLATFHRPHPQPVTDKGAVKSVRKFLMAANITPDTIQ